jgi:Ring finger domain
MSNHNVYPIQFLNDIHNFFPEILYNPGRFRTVQDLLEYIRQGADVNPYMRGLQLYQVRQTHNLFRNTTQTFATTRVPTNTSLPTRTNFSVPVSLVQNSQQLPTVIIDEHQNTDDALSNMVLTILSSLYPINLRDFYNERVEVRPTDEQIRSSTTVHYRASSTNEDICAICQDGFEEAQELRKINHCNHTFHKTCIDTWFQSNVRCPTCRYDIRESTTNETNAPPPVPENYRRHNINRGA